MDIKILHTRERLILATIDIINELGIQGFSTKGVTKKIGVSSGTLFKHFKTKNDLLIAVLNYYSQYDNDIIESVKLKKLSPKDAIIYYIDRYAEYYENYPAITAIMQSYDILTCDPDLEGYIKLIAFNRSDFLKTMIESAQEKGEIRMDIKSEILADIICGFHREICLKWRLNKYGFSLRDKTIETLRAVLEAFG
ncbi:MAG TPA: TetR/AcrR family transcriptional regulator [Clostridia bacterium]|nr:TetR/AcrR family transcriptional regulator [Clostridia bacterium]